MHPPFTLSSPSANSRLPQVPNPSVAALYEDALVYETGSAITSTGALTAYSGAKTGRSPLDKRIVKEPGSENDIWWGYAYPICPGYCRGFHSDCSQTCQQADDTRCKTTFPFSFSIPWSYTGLSRKSHDCCHSSYEIAFQSIRPNGHQFHNSITIASTHCCTITFLFPVAPCTSKCQSSRLFLLPTPHFRRGVGLTRYYVIAALSCAPHAEF
jgi:hypothetical protein